jgi:hypothetical protein
MLKHYGKLLMLAAGMLFVLIISLAGCRKKDPVSVVEPPPVTNYILKVHTLRPSPRPRHTNDTLVVRAYKSTGEIAGGLEVRSKCLSGPQCITGTVYTTADTVHNPWGTTFPLIYISQVDSITHELVDSYLFHQEGTDTLAFCRTSFKLVAP